MKGRQERCFVEQRSSCGIMFRMEEKDFENTQPTRQNPDATSSSKADEDNIQDVDSNTTGIQAAESLSGLEETMPIPVEPGFSGSFSGQEGIPGKSDFGETMPTPVGAAGTEMERSKSGSEPLSSVTMPMKVSPNINDDASGKIDANPTLEANSPDGGVPVGVPKAKPPLGTRRRSLSWLVFPIVGLLALGIIAAMSGLGDIILESLCAKAPKTPR